MLCFLHFLLKQEEHSSRFFQFRKGKDVLLSSTDEVILMDAAAAGSGGKGSVFHGRFGDGCTISIDILLPMVRGEWNSRVRPSHGPPFSTVDCKTESKICKKYFTATVYFQKNGSAPRFDIARHSNRYAVGVFRMSADQRCVLTALSVRFAEEWLSGKGDDGWKEALPGYLRNFQDELANGIMAKFVAELLDNGAIDPLSERHCHFCMTSYDAKDARGPPHRGPHHAGSDTFVRLCNACNHQRYKQQENFYALAAASSCTTVECARCKDPGGIKRARVDSK